MGSSYWPLTAERVDIDKLRIAPPLRHEVFRCPGLEISDGAYGCKCGHFYPVQPPWGHEDAYAIYIDDSLAHHIKNARLRQRVHELVNDEGTIRCYCGAPFVDLPYHYQHRSEAAMTQQKRYNQRVQIVSGGLPGSGKRS